MPDAADILWFKQQFARPIATAVAGTPFDLDMIVAIACQETGTIWPRLRRQPLSVLQIAALCVGDTIDGKPDGSGRRAFPRTKADLLAVPGGQAMFDIARKALVDMAHYIAEYRPTASNPDKFCHGFGVFQADLQFFRTDPAYFLNRKYELFDESLKRCVTNLKAGARKRGFEGRPRLTDEEFATVAIVYNTGGYNPSKGLKQGHYNGARYYGEEVFGFVRLSRMVAPDDGTHIVATQGDALRLRREPLVSDPTEANVMAMLPNGLRVRAITGTAVNGFLEIEAELEGIAWRGFASSTYLRPV